MLHHSFSHSVFRLFFLYYPSSRTKQEAKEMMMLSPHRTWLVGLCVVVVHCLWWSPERKKNSIVVPGLLCDESTHTHFRVYETTYLWWSDSCRRTLYIARKEEKKKRQDLNGLLCRLLVRPGRFFLSPSRPFGHNDPMISCVSWWLPIYATHSQEYSARAHRSSLKLQTTCCVCVRYVSSSPSSPSSIRRHSSSQ